MVEEKKHIHILVVDDELGMRDLLSLELKGQGYQVSVAENGKEATEIIRKQKFDLVISDLSMPQMDGITLLQNIKEVDPELEVIMATGHGTIESAVKAMKNGAYDFILKPFNLDELSLLIEKALEKKKLKTLLALSEASQAVFSTIELDRLLEVIMAMLQKVLGADECSIMLLNEKNKLAIVASHGLSSEIAQHTQLEIGERVAGAVAKERRARLLIDGLENYPEFSGVESNKRVKSSIICPLLSQGELLGVLNISRTNQGNNFNWNDLQSTIIFASQAASAIQNAKLYQNLKKANQEIENTHAQLVQSEKLASIGQLVAGVAHELNNPLMSVIGYSELAQRTEDIKEIYHHLSVIYTQAQRCSGIVKDLLLFARSRKLKYEIVDPCLLVEQVIEGLSLEFEKNKITVVKEFPKTPIKVEVDAHLLKQIFSNILSNAWQALEKSPKDRRIEIKIAVKAENLQMVFMDNGPGISKENIGKIFDPFYTTKEVGQGTGLGLSLSYGIVKEHGGKISVESEMGEKTVFFVELPLKAKEPVSFPPAVDSTGSSSTIQKGTRILLVEDEKPIRELIGKIFDRENMKIDMVADGLIALEKLKVHDYDVVLCDYRMPRLSGVELYKQAVQLKPELQNRFLFVTGAIEFKTSLNSSFEDKAVPCLLKPFSNDELVTAVNEVLKKAA